MRWLCKYFGKLRRRLNPNPLEYVAQLAVIPTAARSRLDQFWRGPGERGVKEDTPNRHFTFSGPPAGHGSAPRLVRKSHHRWQQPAGQHPEVHENLMIVINVRLDAGPRPPCDSHASRCRNAPGSQEPPELLGRTAKNS